MVSLVKDRIYEEISRNFETEGVPVITAQLGTNAVTDKKFRLLK